MSSLAHVLVRPRRAATGLVTCTVAGLALGIAAPAVALPTAPVPAVGAADASIVDATAGDTAPVTVLQLTSPRGETTPIAQDGLDRLAAQGVDPEPAQALGTGAFGAVGAAGASAASLPTVVEQALGITTPSPEEVAPETVRILSEPLETDEFLVAGLTWQGAEELPEGTEVFLRVLEEDAWSPWLPLEEEFSEKDSDGSPAAQPGSRAATTGGTEPFLTGGATAVQVQVATAEGAALPADLQLNLVPAVPEGEDRVVSEAPAATVTEDGTDTDQPTPQEATRSVLTSATTTEQDGPAAQPAGPAGSAPLSQAALDWMRSATAPRTVDVASTLPAAVARPAIISRGGWGADESKMTWTPRQNDIKAAVVHHTAGTNSYAKWQSAGIVRGIYHYHAVTRGWGDVGYNFLFDKYGQIFEGRSGSLWSPTGQIPTGAHASGYNTGTVGVSAMGDYSSVWAPQSILDNMGKVVAWKFAGAGITDANSKSGFIAPGTNFMPRGTELNRVFGHRDVAGVTRTTCPGPNIAARLGAMRSSVNKLVAAGNVGSAGSTAQVTGSTQPTTPVWYLNNNFDIASDLQFEYGLSTDERLVGDWDGDGKDTAGVRRGNVFYLTNGHTSAYDVKVYYGRAEDKIVVGDWDGDGKDTPAVRRGDEYLIQNSFMGGDAEATVYYGRDDDEVHVGDWDGDHRDTLAVRRGTDFHMRNTMTTGDADVSATYGRSGDVAIVGDWNGDGKDTMGVVRNANEYYLRNVIADGEADISVQYGRTTDEPLVGDWDGDGIDTLGLRRTTP